MLIFKKFSFSKMEPLTTIQSDSFKRTEEATDLYAGS